MSKIPHLMRCAAAMAAALVLNACGNQEPEMAWQHVDWDEAGIEMQFPCPPQFARTPVDFGLDIGSVPVHMMGCDAVDSTFAMSYWVLDDAKLADDALAFWQVAALAKFDAVDGSEAKSGAAFVPHGAMELPRSIQATAEGEGRAGWTVTTHGVWFAREEQDGRARIYHAVVYAPKAYHQTAQTFFQSITLK